MVAASSNGAGEIVYFICPNYDLTAIAIYKSVGRNDRIAADKNALGVGNSASAFNVSANPYFPAAKTAGRINIGISYGYFIGKNIDTTAQTLASCFQVTANNSHARFGRDTNSRTREKNSAIVVYRCSDRMTCFYKTFGQQLGQIQRVNFPIKFSTRFCYWLYFQIQNHPFLAD